MDSEVHEKLRRVRALLGNGLDAIVLRAPGNVAWLSAGGRTHIEATPQAGVAAVLITADTVEVVTANNEAPRLQEEELAPLGADWRVLNWSVDLAAALPSGPAVGSDLPYADVASVGLAVEAARRALLPAEVERYRALGSDAALALTDAAETLTAATTEFDAAARISAGLIARGADPVVLLVAGGARLAVHRHPLPTAGPVGDLVMLVACARRHGLIVSLTRFVSTRPLTAEQGDRYARLLQVEAAYLTATRPGTTVGAAFAAGTAAYGAQGFDADEWENHHQGGPTAYAARDYLATADSPAVIEEFQAFAWNPSIPSLKVEDTVLATGSGPIVLSADPRWPSELVDGLDRPGILVV